MQNYEDTIEIDIDSLIDKEIKNLGFDDDSDDNNGKKGGGGNQSPPSSSSVSLRLDKHVKPKKPKTEKQIQAFLKAQEKRKQNIELKKKEKEKEKMMKKINKIKLQPIESDSEDESILSQQVEEYDEPSILDEEEEEQPTMRIKKKPIDYRIQYESDDDDEMPIEPPRLIRQNARYIEPLEVDEYIPRIYKSNRQYYEDGDRKRVNIFRD